MKFLIALIALIISYIVLFVLFGFAYGWFAAGVVFFGLIFLIAIISGAFALLVTATNYVDRIHS